MLPDKSGIYRIRHIESNKGYIGSAVNFRVRWNGHIGTLRRQTHRNSYLQNAFNKYGESAFIFEIIEYVEDKTKLIEREQYWIDFYKAANENYGYNISPTAGNTLGRICTEETKKRISKAQIGKPSPFKGISFDERFAPEKVKEIKKKIIEANLGKIPPNKGKKLDSIKDANLIEKFRVRELGNKRSLGHKHTEEAKEKDRQAHLGKKLSSETISKIVLANTKPREIRICACGCKGTFEVIVTSTKKYIYRHYINGSSGFSQKIPLEIRTCLCGCGNTFEVRKTRKTRFIFGHHTRMPETRKKISEGNKGKLSHRKGKHHTEEAKEKNRLAHIEMYKDGVTHPWIGKHHSQESKNKMSTTQKERLAKQKALELQKK
jgi:group I intron endonuclease